MTAKQSSNLFKIIVAIIAVVPILTGVGDLINGVASQLDFGMPNTAAVTDPMLNSSFRFFAGIWLGVGLFMLLFITNLPKYFTALMLLFATIIIAGVGRIITISQVGLPEPTSGFVLVIVAVVIELIIVPLLMVWLARLRKNF